MAHADPPRVLHLQATAGNRAVQRLVGAIVQRVKVKDVPVTSEPRLGRGLTVGQIISEAVPKTPLDGLRRGEISGNRRFGNREGRLPSTDENGRRITYTEYDCFRYSGRNRGGQRVVIGSDGNRYYTGDHYRTFGRF